MEVGRPGREGDHRAPCKNKCSYVSTPPCGFTAFRGETLFTFMLAKIFITGYNKLMRFIRCSFRFSISTRLLYKKKLKCHCPCNTGEAEVLLHSFLPWHLSEVTGQLHVPASLPPGAIIPVDHLREDLLGHWGSRDVSKERKMSLPCCDSNHGSSRPM
jgi:hypothetical protein